MGSEAIYYKVRDVVRRLGHAESDSCRVYHDWHIELRLGTGHASVWTSDGIVYLTMLDKMVHYRPGPWEDYLARIHLGRPKMDSQAPDLRTVLRARLEAGNPDEPTGGAVGDDRPPDTASDSSPS